MSSPPSTYYFSYGSNLSPTQMRMRCPASQVVGPALLPDYAFTIHRRGYANVLPSPPSPPSSQALSPAPSTPSSDSNASSNPSPKFPGVYGLLYKLGPVDEASLDRYEGVPHAYLKHLMKVGTLEVEGERGKGDGQAWGEVDALVYVCTGVDVTKGRMNDEYVPRMERACREAVKEGVPEDYIEEVVRAWLPGGSEWRE